METNVQMEKLRGIGVRMHEVRTRHRFSQSKVAAMLEISDGAYKNYEAELRDLPLETAVKFCELYDVELVWLVYGQIVRGGDQTVSLVTKTIEAVHSEALRRNALLSPQKAGRIGGFVFSNCLQKNTQPDDEIGPVFDLMAD
jgi:DNA-binding XRE family transcriptional regulator